MSKSNNAEVTTCDGNEAAAYIAFRLSEVCGIYPITPSSPMAELIDQWASSKKTNLWGTIPLVAEMQSEGGAAGAVHGALQSGALTSTFTASQGLLLMLPNMYKIAGELTAAVFHVAARSLAAQGLSIFGDHQDVMAARGTGFALLGSSSVQEAHDMALISHASTLESRIPFIHFFDGFRTSHEVNKISLISDEEIRKMVSDKLVREHRERGLSPDHPFIRGTAQNPDVYFQGRETVNTFYDKVPEIVQANMDKLGKLTGREYKIIEYFGDPKAENLVIAMGSGIETIRETVTDLVKKGEKIGGIHIRLYRPLSAEHLLKEIPKTVKKIAVLDRTKEPGSNGEPLYQDILTAIMENQESFTSLPTIISGRYGLSSKEFTPAMVRGIYEELKKDAPKRHFTIGIIDDVTNLHLEYDESYDIEPHNVVRAMFFGLGSDGTVGANKNTIKIIGEDPAYHAQGYFVYDSKKAGSQTTSHLRFGDQSIASPYLIQSANFIACHQPSFLETTEMLTRATKGSTFLLNTSESPEKVWDTLPLNVQERLIELKMEFYVIDAYKIARETGMGRRINTVMQTCFFALSKVMAKEKAIEKIKKAIEKTYSRKGEQVVAQNFKAVDSSLAGLFEVKVPKKVTAKSNLRPAVSDSAPSFVREVTSFMIAGKGDQIPVSKFPVDGTYPSDTTRWEKRNIAQEIPIWDENLCIQCGNCSVVCPHAAIRAKFYHEDVVENAPDGFKSVSTNARGFPETRYTLQLYPEDCTGCTLCVKACPMFDTENPDHKAINMEIKAPYLEQERKNVEFFETIPYNDRSQIDFSTVRGIQYLQPLFEFSGACPGCGETPYLKMLTQLFGDRLMVANATGCSSIYGGNLPTTPWAKNNKGRGPAWSNSLFEDNAEFGFGFRLADMKHASAAKQLLKEMEKLFDTEFVDKLLTTEQQKESDIQAQIARVDELKRKLKEIGSEQALNLHSIADHLIRRSIWIVGGDGWAYDIGFGGLDHVLANDFDLNILVMDTEVYSNTGGQMSKSTPIGAIAKFAAGGRQTAKKDIAMQAIAYNHIYVAKVALGADPQQALLAMREAEAYPGPSLIVAYSPCIEHGYLLEDSLEQEKLAVKSGHWPLFRYNPALREIGDNPFSLDTLRPNVSLSDYRMNEGRYRLLSQLDPENSDLFMRHAQKIANRKWTIYEEMATEKGNILEVEMDGK